MTIRKKFASVVTAAAMTLSTCAGTVSAVAPVLMNSYAAASSVSEADTFLAEFLNSGYDTRNYTVYDGSNENNFFQINGRKYYQGIKLTRSYSSNSDDGDGIVTFNVSEASNISFTVGRIDNTTVTDTTIKVYKDGEWWQDISMNATETWRAVNLDVSSMSTISFRLDTGSYSEYGFGDFCVDSYTPSMTYSSPLYSDTVSFMQSAYDKRNYTVYDGSNENTYFQVNGRKYYHGIKLTRSYSSNSDDGDGIATFNVENANSISFTVGRIDNTTITDTTIKVYRNGDWWQDITVGANETWKDVNLDVSELSTISFRLDTGSYAEYGLGDIYVDSYTPSMTYSSPMYSDTVSFMQSAYDTRNYTVYDGSNENTYFQVNGRKYYQGIKLTRSYSGNSDDGDGIATFNVENVSSISFTVGRIDNTTITDTTIKVYRNGDWWQDITVGANETWKKVNLDVSGLSTISFRLDTGSYSEYGLGDFCVDSYTPSMTYSSPMYSDTVSFMQSAYDTRNYTVYDGSNENTYFQMDGRKYYQGIKLTRSYSGNSDDGDGIATFNVENVSSISFTLGRIDNSTVTDTTIKIYKNGNWWKDITIGATETWTEVSLDLGDAATLMLRLDTGSYAEYGLGDIYVDSYTPSMTYTSPEYTGAVSFMQSAYDKRNYTIYDGSNEYSYFNMNGKKYYQGIILTRSYSGNSDDGDGIATFNTENVDSLTFTLGRIDSTESSDTTLNIYKNGNLWYTLKHGANDLAKAYSIDTSDAATLSFRLDTGYYAEYALGNIAINGDYSEFSDGSYAVNQTVYDDPSKITSIESLIAAEEEAKKAKLGDVNEDKAIDAVDASQILSAYARVATGGDLGFTDKQKTAADVNKDTAIDAVDASQILAFYAYTATGGALTFEEYLAK